MSVIQEMLQSLDARGAPTAVPGVNVAAHLAPAAPRWRLPVIVGAGVAAVALVAFGDWPALLGTGKQTPAMAAPAPAGIDAAPPAMSNHAAIQAAVGPDSATPVGARTVESTSAEPAAESTRTRKAAADPIEPMRAAPRASAARDVVQPAASATAQAPQPLHAEPGLLPPLLPRIEKRPSAGQLESRAQSVYRQAVAAAQAGQRQTALPLAHEAIALDRRHAAARQLAAVLEHELGDTDRATQVLREGLAIDARQATMALLLARLLVTQGNADAALAVLSDHGVDGGEADGLRGGVLAQRGDYRNSLTAYESALRHQPGNPIWWLGLGVALESDGQPQRARQAYGRAQSLGLRRDDLAGYVDQRLRALE